MQDPLKLLFIYNIFVEYTQQGTRTPISVYACTARTLIGPVVLLYTCYPCCRLCSVQCHNNIKPVAPSCAKLRTTWGKLQHNFRNILSCVDQSQGSKTGDTTRNHQTAHRSVYRVRPGLKIWGEGTDGQRDRHGQIYSCSATKNY